MENFTKNGIWWLPDNTEKKLVGTLTFDRENGGTLDIVGAFEDHIQNYIDRKTLNPNIILGITTDGELATLIECRSIGSKVIISSVDPPQTSKFDVTAILLGEHFQTLEEVKFNSIEARFRHFDQWLEISGFETIRALKGLTVKYTHPETATFSLSDSLSLSIFFKTKVDEQSRPQTESKITQKAFFRIKSDALRHINDFTDDVICISQFVSLGVRHAVILLEMSGKIDGEVSKEVQIFYVPPYADQFFDVTLSIDRMLFPYSFVKDDFQSYILKWYAIKDEFKPIIESFFSIRSNPSSYPRHKFLSYMQAIESYHRKKFPGKLIADELYNSSLKPALNKTIENILNDDDKKNFVHKLEYLNEYSLRNRLKELFASEMFEPLIKAQPIAPFVDQLVNWRNYLTHFDKSLEAQCNNFQVLRGIVPKLEPILETLILELLGMTNEQIETLILKKWINPPTMTITRA
jgi:hypothetical protein